MSDGQSDDGEDKSHDPTPQKLKKSREEGEVVHSTEVTSAATYGALYLIIIIMGGWISTNIGSLLKTFLQRPDDVSVALLRSTGGGFALDLVLKLIIGISPVFLGLALATICSLLVQRAVVFAPSKLKPKISRISVISNAKQKYGSNGLFEFFKSFVKLSAILSILFFFFKDRFLEFPALSAFPASSFASVIHRETVFFTGLITIVAVGIATIDYPWKRAQHHKKLMMTFQELKKENKESEGDPAMKNARRERAHALATNHMMDEVPKANVIIVNPTHYAVALMWDRKNGGAPVCVAKGVDEVAARIRKVGTEAGVPIKRDPPIARSIYAVVEIGKEIKREHYAAVAAAIHYADEVQKKSKERFADEA